MTETRDFPTDVIVSLSTGRLLCKFSDMHEAAEYLMGHPIWTHHLASKELWGEMQKTIIEQCPDVPTADIDGVPAENVHEHIARLENDLGPMIRIRRGGGLTAMLPTDGIPDHLKNNTIMVSVK